VPFTENFYLFRLLVTGGSEAIVIVVVGGNIFGKYVTLPSLLMSIAFNLHGRAIFFALGCLVAFHTPLLEFIPLA
jgi:hypothetical protein